MTTVKEINTGNKPNDGIGDTLEEAFNKINHNFKEYSKKLNIKFEEIIYKKDFDFQSPMNKINENFKKIENSFKYYTPKIDEFYVGFEFEYMSPYNDKYSNEWNAYSVSLIQIENGFSLQNISYIYNKSKGIINPKYFLTGIDKKLEKIFRVKYLDKEDIESLGFKYNTEYHGDYFYSKEDMELIYRPENNWLSIKKSEDTLLYNLFYGKIKNKSELKKLLKQLCIIKEQ